jgi:3-deoxy-manno-octulosonate cytidylyltransferase (CMP-KDO synthetase)
LLNQGTTLLTIFMTIDNFIGIIPSRFASTRFPGKPLADIGGKSMVQRVYEQASKVLTHVYVATDDMRIFDAVTKFGGKVVMTDSHHQSGTDRCAEAVKNISAQLDKTFEVVVNIQGDEPFIAPEQIELLCRCFDNKLTDIATLVKPIDQNDIVFDPNKPKVVIGAQGQALYFSRSPIPHLRGIPQSEWHLKHTYLQHIGLYAYRTTILNAITVMPTSLLETAESLEQLRWIENGLRIAVEQTKHESIGIDTPEDLEAAKKAGWFNE